MPFSRFLRSGLFLASTLAIAGAAAGSGCAQPATIGTTGTSGGGNGLTANCTGTPPACAGLGDFECQTTAGCKHTGKCGGTALECSLLSATGCLLQPGCTPATFGNCSGSAQSCFNFNSQFACSQQKGCTWDQNNFFCSGSPTFCAQLTNQDCAKQLGCILNATSECQGAPTACTTYMAKDECGTSLGCAWLSGCAGTANACETFADADCRFQPGCSCDGCETTSSSTSSGGPGPCKNQNDCDPAQDPCRTGNCINGECVMVPNCQPCLKQIECNPSDHPCFTGNCIDGMCQAAASCLECTVPGDCSSLVNKCFSGNCVDGTCELRTMCTSGDGCCPSGCAGMDSDCP